MLSRNTQPSYPDSENGGHMTDRRLEPSGDPGHERADLVWQPPQMPVDQARLGLDRNTVEGAWVEFAAALDRSRVGHRVIAWVLLVVLLLSVVLALGQQISAFWPL
jgi:hypothetical protein